MFSADNLTKTLALQFAKIWHSAPQEKLYLHTDKPYYSAGETIWFSAYLLNAATHLPDTQSRYVYVELIDAGNSLIQRIKIRKDSISFGGRIELPPETPPGIYSLYAYTHWMQNAPADFFFKKSLFIGNSIDDRINLSAQFDKLKDGKLPVTLTFTNQLNAALSSKTIELEYSWEKPRKTYTVHSDNNGVINLQLPNTANLANQQFISVKINQDENNYNRKIFLPQAENQFDLQFFPESGTFLDNQMQIIGFKAIGSNGLSVEVTGKIYNNQDIEILDFASVHNGMGRMALNTSPAESYYAIAKIADGTAKRFELPKTQSAGVALHLAYYRNNVLFQVTNQSSTPTDSLFLLVHSRGVVITAFPLTAAEGALPETILPAGIVSFAIVDSLQNTYCERLYFSRNFQIPDISMSSDKNSYAKRQKAVLNFNISDPTGKPATGSFSISITDSKTVKGDTSGINIQNYLLLQSDIKGYIEKPNDYFADNSLHTREKTDILMLTQAWKRFSTANIVAKKYPENETYLELGQTVSGRVYNIFGKGVKKHPVIMFMGYKNQIATTDTDDEGKFILQGIEFPDSTKIILKAKSKAIVDVGIESDIEIFPTNLFDFPHQQKINNEILDYYLQISEEKYYAEGGMHLINLSGITVTAKKPRDTQEAFYASMASTEITAEKIEEWPGLQIFDLLGMIAGIQVNGQEISIRGGGTPLFVIDGVETQSPDDVYFLNPSDVQSIFVYKGIEASMMFGSRASNGAIAIMLKRGAAATNNKESSSLTHITPLGFQKPAQFYVPKYDVDSIYKQATPDLRTTIYWNPAITSDSAGQVSVSFFTADKNNDYDITLEGITNEGLICRFRK
ncbi:MAG: TonB-dependent receptor plug domain-containing protein, partial [Paludibacter sp.]|nr:TonB-dependent receptor plug domain-containing protein [Paludibacter sp.]